jgi:hypothetical protein
VAEVVVFQVQEAVIWAALYLIRVEAAHLIPEVVEVADLPVVAVEVADLFALMLFKAILITHNKESKKLKIEQDFNKR